MNTTFFKSWYAIVALVIVGGFTAWLLAIGARPGNQPGSDTTFLLTSGWVAFSLMVVVTLYTLRKRIHQLGLSPETRHRLPHRNLERAETLLNELRVKVLRGVLSERADIEHAAQQAMRDAGVARIARATVEPGRPGEPRFVIQVTPTEPLGRVAKWLHAHLYLGLAFGVLVWLHGGGSVASPLAAAMTILSAVVVVTGVLGIFLFALGPSWMTARERDLSIEKAYVLSKSLSRELASTREGLTPRARTLAKSVESSGKRRHAAFETLETLRREEPESCETFEDFVILSSQRNGVLTELRALARLKLWINFWRVVHIPASIVLFGVVVLHVYTVLRY